MEPADLAARVVAGTGAAPTLVVRVVAVRLVVVACQAVERVPEVHLTVPHHRRLLRQQRA